MGIGRAVCIAVDIPSVVPVDFFLEGSWVVDFVLVGYLGWLESVVVALLLDLVVLGHRWFPADLHRMLRLCSIV